MSRRRRGGLRPQLFLEPHQVELMQALLDEMSSVLDGTHASDDSVNRRLFPSAYRDNEKAEADFRSMTQATLRSDRLDRISACAGELAASGEDSGTRRGVEIDLGDPDTARRWIQVLNDIRLALGTRLGVSEDDEPDLGPDDPQTQPWLVYYWLTATQDAVVTALMR